jgi:hypothetical protein
MTAEGSLMTNEERLQKTIRLEPVDKILSAAQIMEFAATYCGMSQAEFLDPDRGEEAVARVFDELGPWDIVAMSPGTLRKAKMFLKVRLPGRDLPEDSISQIMEEEVMLPEDYDVVIEHGYEALNERLSRRLGLQDDGQEPPPDEDTGVEKHEAAWEARGVAVLLGGGPGSHPFELFSFHRSLAKFAMDIRRMPDKVKAAVEACIPEFIDISLRDVERTGRRRVLLANARGSSVFINEKTFEDLVLPAWLEFVRAMDEADVDVVFHCDTDWTRFLPYFKEFPRARCLLELDGATDILKAKEVLGGHMALMGDVPATLLTLGTPDEVTAYCENLIETVGEGRGFILASGCTTPHDAKVENVKAMLDAGK